ncbi:MAG: hypothetical protein DWQ02_06580 [Bacteroidetes bacterium]|nr:MAG: hypothetical protein DWQ02_06580 [Bacteroidota bacterium]
MNRLDDFVKGKMEQRQFEFDQAHWLQAAEMIDAQQKRRRRFFWIWLLCGLVVLSGTSYMLWKPSAITSQPLTTNLTEETGSSLQTVKTERQQKEAKIDLPQNEVQETITNDEAENIITTKDKKASQLEAGITDKPIAKAFQQVDEKMASSESVPVKISNTITPVEFEELPDAAPPITAVKDPVRYKSFVIDQIPQLNFDLLNNDRDWQADFIKVEGRPYYSSKFGIHASTTVYPHIGSTGKNVIGYVAGIDYAKSINKNWSIGLGAQYRLRSGTFAEDDFSEQTTYAFSRTVERFYTLPEQLRFVELPLAINYVKNRHNVGVGVSPGYLLGIKGSLNKEGYGESFPQGNAHEVVEKGWIQSSGFKPLHWDVFGSWYFAVNTEMSLGVKVNYTAGSLLKDQASSIYLESKPFFFDVGLRYNLIKR